MNERMLLTTHDTFKRPTLKQSILCLLAWAFLLANRCSNAPVLFADAQGDDEFVCSGICRPGEFVFRPIGFVQSFGFVGTCQEAFEDPALIRPEFCDAVQNDPIIREICRCSSCPVCGPDEVITIPDGFIETVQVSGTCEFLDINQFLIPIDFCETIQVSSLIKNTCGCVNPTNPDANQCQVCGPDLVITNPEGRLVSAEVNATCQEVADGTVRIPVGFCGFLQTSDLVKVTCACAVPREPSASPSEAPSIQPTPGSFISIFVERIGDAIDNLGITIRGGFGG